MVQKSDIYTGIVALNRFPATLARTHTIQLE